MDPEELITAVRRQKSLAHRNRSAGNWLLLACVVVGTGVGSSFALWNPLSGIGLLPSVSIGLILGTAIGAYWKVQVRRDATSAACPSCNYSWEILEGAQIPTASQMPSWDRCPGCGLLMNESVLRLKLQGKL
jgi:hypothetical protein